MKLFTRIIILILVVALVGGGLFRLFWTGGERLAIVHWTTGHLMRNGLLPDMAVKFNQIVHRTDTGKRIEIKVFNCPSRNRLKIFFPV